MGDAVDLNPGSKVSVVVGLVYPRENSPLAKGRFSWPFARVTVDQDSVTLAPRGFLAKLVRPITIAFTDLVRVDRAIPPRVLPFGGGLRFRSSLAEGDGLCVAAPVKSVLKLVEALRRAGVEVE